MSGDQKFWDKIADRYAASPVRDPAAYAHTLDRVRAHLRSDHSVLELGAGTGSTAVTLAPEVATICASDLSPAMIEIARGRADAAGLGNMTTAVGAVSAAPDGPFDVVLGMNLFHLLPDLDSALADVAARVCDGGLFISKTPCLGDMEGWKWRLMLLGLPLAQRLGKAPSVVQKFTVLQMDQAVAAAGFEIIETGNFPADPPSHFIVARKRSPVA